MKEWALTRVLASLDENAEKYREFRPDPKMLKRWTAAKTLFAPTVKKLRDYAAARLNEEDG